MDLRGFEPPAFPMLSGRALVGQSVPYCELFGGRFHYRPRQSRPSCQPKGFRAIPRPATRRSHLFNGAAPGRSRIATGSALRTTLLFRRFAANGAGLGKPSSVAPWPGCKPFHSRPDGQPATDPTSPQSRATPVARVPCCVSSRHPAHRNSHIGPYGPCAATEDRPPASHLPQEPRPSPL